MAVYFITAISPFTIRSLFMTCKFPSRRHERIVSSFCGKGNKCLQISSDFVLFWPRGNFLFAAYRHHPAQHFFPTHQVTFFLLPTSEWSERDRCVFLQSRDLFCRNMERLHSTFYRTLFVQAFARSYDLHRITVQLASITRNYFPIFLPTSHLNLCQWYSTFLLQSNLPYFYFRIKFSPFLIHSRCKSSTPLIYWKKIAFREHK